MFKNCGANPIKQYWSKFQWFIVRLRYYILIIVKIAHTLSLVNCNSFVKVVLHSTFHRGICIISVVESEQTVHPFAFSGFFVASIIESKILN